MFSVQQFDYSLPPEYIAQEPLAQRDASKLLVLERQTREMRDLHFFDLVDVLSANDVLVRNNTKVIPARLLGQKSTGGNVEILLLTQSKGGLQTTVWECLTKPGLKNGQKIFFAHADLTATCIQVNEFTRLIEFSTNQQKFFSEIEKIGHTPIPPYIRWNKDDEQKLRRVYQTTYAKFAGSVAAPTAGLHFTPQLDEKLQAKGVDIVEVTLHVGAGTFLPVREEQLASGTLHHEVFEVSKDAAEKLNLAKRNGKRIISVGTTTTRVLETVAEKDGTVHPSSGETTLFIQPGYRFRFVDALVTNFHLPQSSLLFLVSAFTTAPNAGDKSFTDFQHSLIGQSYQHAIASHYRFYSFGDAMLIL